MPSLATFFGGQFILFLFGFLNTFVHTIVIYIYPSNFTQGLNLTFFGRMCHKLIKAPVKSPNKGKQMKLLFPIHESNTPRE